MLREAQLDPAFASEYPNVIPGRWYTAAAVAGLVKGIRILRDGPDAPISERVLSQAHFTFRGGMPRHGSWLGLRSRRVDRRNPSRRLVTV